MYVYIDGFWDNSNFPKRITIIYIYTYMCMYYGYTRKSSVCIESVLPLCRLIWTICNEISACQRPQLLCSTKLALWVASNRDIRIHILLFPLYYYYYIKFYDFNLLFNTKSQIYTQTQQKYIIYNEI